ERSALCPRETPERERTPDRVVSRPRQRSRRGHPIAGVVDPLFNGASLRGRVARPPARFLGVVTSRRCDIRGPLRRDPRAMPGSGLLGIDPAMVLIGVGG